MSHHRGTQRNQRQIGIMRGALLNELERLGLQAAIEDDILVISAPGGRVAISARQFHPVPGLAGVQARLVCPGEGEIRIAGRTITVSGKHNMGEIPLT
jgi:hypothetical protein